MSAKDKLGAHLREELGIDESQRARPLQAAWISAASFASFALVPIAAMLVSPASIRIPSIAILSLASLAALGAFGAHLGGAPKGKAALRVALGGGLAMAVTAGVGRLLGVSMGLVWSARDDGEEGGNMGTYGRRSHTLRVTLAILLVASATWAGPPYVTDDPEPVEYRHWEVYLASQHAHDKDGWSGTAPHVEVNYGVIPDVQLHVIAPLAYAAPSGGKTHYGYGDTELGVKLRFVHEGAWMPQVGTFPFLELPTGSQTRGLGNGSAQVFVPLWIQKSFGAWTTYGGGGIWLDTGGEHDRWGYLGWMLQRHVIEALALGVEIFHLTPRGAEGESDTRFNVGAVLDVTDAHHILLSAGRSIEGPNQFQGYAAYQLTFGPAEEDKAKSAE